MAHTSSKILILGGSGFLSGALARLALAHGHRVWSVTRGQRPPVDGVTALLADRHSPEAFAAAIAGAGVAWDLAVDCIGFTAEDARQDLVVLGPHAAQLVFISTDFIYDPARRRFPQDEDAAGYATAGYGGQKRLAELELIASDPVAGMPWTILRPCHIYGPGSQLGCLPAHGRDPQLIARLRAGEPLRLVGGGHFLQQPLLAEDLARVILDLQGNQAARRQVLCVAGPDTVESREYYRLVAEALGAALQVEELPVAAYLAEHPEAAPFLCHRIYDMRRLREAGIAPPATPLVEGLRRHVASLLGS
jgi:nucleoside-diphosphate-sugar epimerase